MKKGKKAAPKKIKNKALGSGLLRKAADKASKRRKQTEASLKYK